MDSIMKQFEHLVIKLEEVKLATDNFTDTKIIGKGGFGNVYEGELSQSRGKTKAAFKRLNRKHGQGDPQFWKEVMMLSRYTHENLISLLGFCDEGGEKILVYEQASNGSLDRHLSSTTLTWSQRIRICHDAAKGLCYLHEDKGNHHRVLHRDIKSSNILLDENWKAKVSDMGLAKVGPCSQFTFLMTDIVGTFGYIDPMYLRMGFLTKESDVYSFGVVLFEVLCGRLCFDNSNARSGNIVHIWKQRYEEKKLDEIVFKDDLLQALDQSCLEMFAEIAFQCLQDSREARPKMSGVVEKLEIALKHQELVDLIPKEYREIVKAMGHPLICRSVEEFKVLLTKGVLLNGGKTWFSINEKGEHIERIYIEACFVFGWSLKYLPDDIVNSRFPGGRCYHYQWGFRARVRGEYLTPHISYRLNLVFRYKFHSDVDPLRYKIDGEDETKVLIIYVATHMREDGWFVVPLYHSTIQHTTADLQFVFESRDTTLLVAGFEFQPYDDKIRLKKKQEEDKEQKRKEKEEKHLYTIIKVVRDENLYEQIGKNIFFDLVDLEKVRHFRIRKQTSFALFKEEIAKELGIPVQYQRFWLWVKRQNYTYRPHRPLTPLEETQTVGHVGKVSRKISDGRYLFLEAGLGQVGHLGKVPNDSNKLNLFPDVGLGQISQKDILLFFKLYDPIKEELRYVGRLFVNGTRKPTEILAKLSELAGFALDEDIELFEEIRFEPKVMCEHIDKNISFWGNQLENGDIICLQKSLQAGTVQYRYSNVPSFLEYVHSRQVNTQQL